jgi:hypothetical protein
MEGTTDCEKRVPFRWCVKKYQKLKIYQRKRSGGKKVVF